MRIITRLLVLIAIVTLTAGPVLAAPLVHARNQSIADWPAVPPPVGTVLTWIGYAVAAVGAIRIKDTASLAKKFVARASAASGDYTEGVKSAGADWEQNTKASEENYKIGVQQAAADGRFGKGVSNAGQGKYVTRASTLGAQRYPSGVGAAEGDWAKGAQPYLDTLKALELPPRRPKGDPGNMARANAVATRLRSLKVGR